MSDDIPERRSAQESMDNQMNGQKGSEELVRFLREKELEAQLFQANERIKALENPWVSVDERLPEFPVEVFVKYEGEKDHGADFIDSQGKWYMGDANGFLRTITHWMLIPVPAIPENTND